MAEAPPLNRIYVFGYSANDRDYPIVSLNADPRVAGYQVPKDLSACPDKRYPNHLFTGAQPISGDQRVRHVWEILPSPWVPFTRYDDDLGPVQGRRRSVKNEGQVATLSADKRTTYEGREGSAIVLTETEESWSIKTDANGNSLFPVKTRNFYDPSRGDVKETRQLIVATGKETATLTRRSTNRLNTRPTIVDIDIVQTTYEPYNQFLSFKIVQTYRVAGPQLVGQSTNNEGQLVQVTTQRKAFLGYRPPSPTATKTVEVNREDAASVVERIVDAPKVFDSKTVSASKPDVIPEQFRASKPTQTTQETVAQSVTTMPTLGANDLEKSEQRVTEFTVRKTTTSRDNATLPTLRGQDYEPSVNIVVPFDESVVASGSKLESPATIVDPLSADFDLVREFDLTTIETELNKVSLEFPTRTSLSLPPVLRRAEVVWSKSSEHGKYSSNGVFPSPFVGSSSVSESASASGSSSVKPEFIIDLEEVYANNIPTTSYIFFLKYPVTLANILAKVEDITKKTVTQWPVFQPRSTILVASGESKTLRASASGSYSLSGIRLSEAAEEAGVQKFQILKTEGSGTGGRVDTSIAVAQIPPCLDGGTQIKTNTSSSDAVGSVEITFTWSGSGEQIAPAVGNTKITSKGSVSGSSISRTSPSDIPRTGLYLIDSKVDLYQYGFARIYAEVLDASVFKRDLQEEIEVTES
jgi:hypothetical protein